MEKDYSKYENYWNSCFAESDCGGAVKESLGSSELETGLKWLSEGSRSVLDFGCGSGTLLFFCSRFGTQEHTGIDFSKEAIRDAEKRAKAFPDKQYSFYQGSAELLKKIPEGSMDAVILSNILDNLYPEDSQSALRECHRILRVGGKILIKLNPYFSADELKEEQATVVENNLVDDGLLLWNLPTKEWDRMLGQYFVIHSLENAHFQQYEGAVNRLYRAIKEE